MPTDSTTSPKRACLAASASSIDAFDLRIRTLYADNGCDMPGCLEITPLVRSQTKDYGFALIVLADTSGSMAADNRIQKLRDGVVRLAELSGRFASMRTELTIVNFSDDATVVHSSGGMPSAEELARICGDLTPGGMTNIGAALSKAAEIADSKRGKAVHVLLFTDGEDTFELQSALNAGTCAPLASLAEHPMLWVHCVGICTAIDCRLLNDVVRTAQRGTFQCIADDNISRLMGSLWGLMIEAVDFPCSVRVEADGGSDAVVLDRKSIVLRICDPPVPCLMSTGVIAKGTRRLSATLTVGDTARTWTAELATEDGSPRIVDEVCGREFASGTVAACALKVAEALRGGDFDAAAEANAKAIGDIQALPAVLSECVRAAVEDLEAQRDDIGLARVNYDLARDLEARAMSRSATERAGVSIDPHSRSLSELQTQLSI